jgi:hypothetical protein
VDSVVLPEYRSRGAGSQLIEARFDLIRRLNLRGMLAGSIIIDYYTVADELTAEQYVAEVVSGKRWDTNLSKQIRKGFKVHGLIPNYTVNEECLGWGVEIVWENPDYRPQRKPARPVTPALYPAFSHKGA